MGDSKFFGIVSLFSKKTSSGDRNGSQKKILLYWLCAIIFLVLFQYGLYKIHDMRLLNLADDVLAASFIAYVFFLASTKRIKPRRSAYDYVFLLFFAVAIVSSLSNIIPVNNFLLGMKGYFLFFFLFYAVYWVNFSSSEIKTLISFVSVLFYLQFVIAVWQIAHALAIGDFRPDTVSAAMSGANFLGYTLFPILYFCLYDFVFNHEKKQLLNVIFFSGLMILSSARLALLLFPVFFIFLNLDRFKWRETAKVIAGFAVFFLIISMVGTRFVGGGKDIFSFYTPQRLIYQFTVEEFNVSAGSARNLWFPLTKDNLEKNSKEALGFGPGMYASFAAYTLMPKTNYLIYDYYNQSSIGVDTNIDSQIIPIWGELGYIGVAVAFIMLAVIAIRLYRKAGGTDKEKKAIVSTSLGYTWFFIVGYYFNHMLEAQTTALMFFLFLALAETCIAKERKNAENEV